MDLSNTPDMSKNKNKKENKKEKEKLQEKTDDNKSESTTRLMDTTVDGRLLDVAGTEEHKSPEWDFNKVLFSIIFISWVGIYYDECEFVLFSLIGNLWDNFTF